MKHQRCEKEVKAVRKIIYTGGSMERFEVVFNRTYVTIYKIEQCHLLKHDYHVRYFFLQTVWMT